MGLDDDLPILLENCGSFCVKHGMLAGSAMVAEEHP
jgi:hypothetical protein